MSFDNSNPFSGSGGNGFSNGGFDTRPDSFSSGFNTGGFGSNQGGFKSEPSAKIGSLFDGTGFKSNDKPAMNGFFTGTQDRIGVNDDIGRMRVTRALMVPAGSFYNQHYRPITAHARPERIDFFADATNNGTQLNPAAIARANIDFLTPSASVSREVAQISNGWDTARFTFIIKVDATLAGDVETSYLLFGYTSHTGCTMSGAVDPNMELFFTRCISTRNMETKNAFGVKNSTPMVSSANNILFKDRFSRDSLHTLRPEDVVGHAALPKVMDNFNEYESYDSRTVLGRTAKLSSMTWSNPNMYLSRSLSHYSNVLKTAEQGYGSGGSQYEKLLDGIQDENPIHCAPLRFLKNNTGWGETMRVEWKELVSAFPEISRDEITEIQVPQPAVLSSMDARNSFAETNGAGYEHVIASRLAQELPAIMMSKMFVSLGFTVSNDVVDNFGRPKVFIESWDHMIGGDLLASSMETFKSDFIDTIYMSLSKSNQVALSLQVMFSIYGHGEIRVNYNNSGFTPFKIPVFAESNYSTMITNDSHSVANMSASLAKLMEVVEGGSEFASADKFASVNSFSF